MQAIEFEAVAQNHLIRIPDNIPDGVTIRVLVLVNDGVVIQKNTLPESNDVKTLLTSVMEGLEDSDFERPEAQQRKKNLKEALNKVVALNAFEGIDGVEWQKEQRQDRMIEGFFERLCLDDDFSSNELALLFERDNDTGRDSNL